jgi:hypothetical protein
MSGELNGTMTDAVYLRRLPNWISRLFGELVADLKLVDCGSLDVLVYCADDLTVGSTRDSRLPGPVDAP